MRAALYLSFASFLTAFAVGCDNATVACTDLAAFAVSGDVVDMDDMLVEDATVQYQVDDGALVDCENVFEGSFSCGLEVDGEITVVATSGTASAEMTFDIESDECHVIGQTADLQLDL